MKRAATVQRWASWRALVALTLLAGCGGCGRPGGVGADGADGDLWAAEVSGEDGPTPALPSNDTTAGDQGRDGEPADGEALGDVCQSVCPVTACGLDDGCGASCPACPSTVSCVDCALRLELTPTKVVAGVVRRASLALVYDPPAGAVGPSTAEIRLAIDGPASLAGLDVGAPISEADKSLSTDGATGLPYRIEPDGTVRVVVLSTANVNTIGGGVWWTWDLLLGEAFAAPTAPVVLWLRHDGPLFAPPAAELDVADPRTFQPVAVWPGVESGG